MTRRGFFGVIAGAMLAKPFVPTLPAITPDIAHVPSLTTVVGTCPTTFTYTETTVNFADPQMQRYQAFGTIADVQWYPCTFSADAIHSHYMSYG